LLRNMTESKGDDPRIKELEEEIGRLHAAMQKKGINTRGAPPAQACDVGVQAGSVHEQVACCCTNRYG